MVFDACFQWAWERKWSNFEDLWHTRWHLLTWKKATSYIQHFPECNKYCFVSFISILWWTGDVLQYKIRHKCDNLREKSYFCVAKTSWVMISSILNIWALEEHFDRGGFFPLPLDEIFVPIFDIPTGALVVRCDIWQNFYLTKVVVEIFNKNVFLNCFDREVGAKWRKSKYLKSRLKLCASLF